MSEREAGTRIGVVIPCYNVEKTVGKVLGAFSDATLSKLELILVIDNCSSDATFRLLTEAKAKDSPLGRRLHLIRNTSNQGYGGSQKIAYQYFLDHGITHFMVIHGDNQANAEIVAKNFLEAFAHDPSIDMILTSRFIPGSKLDGYSRLRILGNHAFNFVTRMLTGLRMSDHGAAIVFLKTDLLKRIPFKTFTSGYQFHPQLNIAIHEDRSIRTETLPINWGDSEAGSTLNLTRYGLVLLSLLLTYAIRRRILRRPLEEVFTPKN